MAIDLWVLTCAPGSRRAEAIDLFESLGTEQDKRVVVTNPPDAMDDFPGILLRHPSTELNIGNWWTLGLDYIASHYDATDIWDVLVIETDARMSVEDVDKIRDYMRFHDTVMAGADWRHVLGRRDFKVRRDNSSWIPVPEQPDAGRIPGIACVISGEAGIRHDPEFRWWLADDDFEWQHRVNGGTILVSGTSVYHVGTQGELQGERLQAWNEDQGKFMAKWGGMPGTGGILPSKVVERTHESHIVLGVD